MANPWYHHYPRKLKKALFRYCATGQLTPKQRRQVERLFARGRNIADYGQQRFIDHCLEAVWNRGYWDYRLFD
jgi:hypothetical protein